MFVDRFCFKKNPEDFFQLHILGFEADGLHGSTRHTCKVGAGTRLDMISWSRARVDRFGDGFTSQ